MPSRESYCNTSTDLLVHLPNLGRMYEDEQVIASGSDGVTTANSATFTSATATFSTYGVSKFDTLIVLAGETGEGVYHVAEDASEDTTLTASRKFRSSGTAIDYIVTPQFREACERCTLLMDDAFADLSRIIAVPFNRLLLSASLSAEDYLDETIPRNPAGYLLDVTLSGVSMFPVVLTLTGSTEDRDWSGSPTGKAESVTETMSFSSNTTQTTSTRFTADAFKVESDYTTDGTITIRLSVPERVKHLTALRAALMLAEGQYTQFRPNAAEWLETAWEQYNAMLQDYRDGAMRLAEISEGTKQRSMLSSARLLRG